MSNTTVWSRVSLIQNIFNVNISNENQIITFIVLGVRWRYRSLSLSIVIIMCSMQCHLGMQLLLCQVQEEKCSSGKRWEGRGKRNISRTHLNGRAAWGMPRSARQDSRGMVHRIFPRCIRRRWVFTCATTTTTTDRTHTTTTIIINLHQHHNSKRGNDGLLYHSVSRWSFLFRRDAWYFTLSTDQETFTREFASLQDNIDVHSRRSSRRDYSSVWAPRLL